MSDDKKKLLDLSALDLRKLDLTRKYDDDFDADGLRWSDHLLLYAIVALFVIFLLWANLTTLDELARGEGKVIPSSEVQMIQSLEGGIIDEFLVKSGDVVQEGQIILRMRNVQARADFAATQNKYMGARAVIARLQAEAENKPLEFDADVIAAAPDSVKAEREAYDANKQQIQSQISVLEQQKTQRQQDVSEMQRRIVDLTSVLSLAQNERAMVAPLVEKGAASKMEVLQLDRQIAQQRTELNGVKISIERAQTAVKEAEEKINEALSGFQAEARRQLTEKTVEMNTLKQSLAAMQDKSERTEVKSPVHGTVKELRIKTVGGVAKPGDVIMDIVPLEDALIVEAKIKPSDIAFIYQGQRAVVRISAFDFSVYGAVEGTVSKIAADSTTNDKGDSFYKVDIKTKETTLKKGAKQYPIIPGMQATVDIVTGEKTVMQYLLKPFIKATETAMRER